MDPGAAVESNSPSPDRNWNSPSPRVNVLVFPHLACTGWRFFGARPRAACGDLWAHNDSGELTRGGLLVGDQINQHAGLISSAPPPGYHPNSRQDTQQRAAPIAAVLSPAAASGTQFHHGQALSAAAAAWLQCKCGGA